MNFNFDFSELRTIRNEMREQDISTFPFFFGYNGVNTFASLTALSAVEHEQSERAKYALFHIFFTRQNDLNVSTDLYLNANGIIYVNEDEFRAFFHVRNGFAGAGFWTHFCRSFLEAAPRHCDMNTLNPQLTTFRREMVYKRANLDPANCYRLSIIRIAKKADGTRGQRDPFRFEVAQEKFPNATAQYGDDKTITYGFTDDPSQEVDEDVAIARFIKNEEKRMKTSQ